MVFERQNENELMQQLFCEFEDASLNIFTSIHETKHEIIYRNKVLSRSLINE